ncbi:MAG: RES family NAD+ phosphorylase [Bacteroidetes bacterium]|nr:RES family NAD+ phosphorylase [Bacteroidota bacterium]
MEVYRLTRSKFAAFVSGKGAAEKGARWNSIGMELIYTASNRSLAMAEVAVHFTLATLPTDYMMMTIIIPEEIKVGILKKEELPEDWNMFPHLESTQKLGDNFIRENKYCILKVPSVVTKGDFNYLINPNHKEFGKIKIVGLEDFPFDLRIFK